MPTAATGPRAGQAAPPPSHPGGSFGRPKPLISTAWLIAGLPRAPPRRRFGSDTKSEAWRARREREARAREAAGSKPGSNEAPSLSGALNEAGGRLPLPQALLPRGEVDLHHLSLWVPPILVPGAPRPPGSRAAAAGGAGLAGRPPPQKPSSPSAPPRKRGRSRKRKS